MPEWTTACPDWAERLKKGQSIIPAPIYPEQAEIALNVFRQLKIVDAPGSPTFGESCAQWVFDLVAALFGSYDAETGRRHITEVFVLIPKKNSKSTLAAGIMMTALLLNWRQAAGYTIIAPTVEVATNAFNPARDMVKRDDDLDDLCQVQTHIRTITHRGTDTTLKVVAADPNTVSGIKSVGTLIDELWLFGKQHNSEDMLREAVGGMASRPEGFVMYTTTQSNEPPAGVFKKKLQYARDVRDGKIHDPHFLPVIFEHPPEMVASGEHLLLDNLAMVNPNLGYSVDEQFLYREYNKAKEAGKKTSVALCPSTPTLKSVSPCALTDGQGQISGSNRQGASLLTIFCAVLRWSPLVSMAVVSMTFSAWLLSGAIARRASGYAGAMHGHIPSPWKGERAKFQN